MRILESAPRRYDMGIRLLSLGGVDAMYQDVDAVASSLALSETSADERLYVLRAASRVLRPGGRLVVADEVRPKSAIIRAARAAARFPLAAIAYLFTQTSTTAIPDLAGLVRSAGYPVEREDHVAQHGGQCTVGDIASMHYRPSASIAAPRLLGRLPIFLRRRSLRRTVDRRQGIDAISPTVH